MARVLVRHLVGVRSPEGHLALVADALVAVRNLADDDDLDVYETQLGGAPLAQPLRTSALGVVEFWTEQSAVVAVLHISADALTSVVGSGPVTFPAFEEAVPLNGQGTPGTNGLPGAAAMGVIASDDTATTTPLGIGEHELVSVAFPADRVTSGDHLRLRVPSAVTVNTATATATFRVKLDSTTLLTSAPLSLGASINPREALLNVEIDVGPDGLSETVSIAFQVATGAAGVDIEVEASTLIGAVKATENLANGGTISVTVEFSTATASYTRESYRLLLSQAVASIPVTVTPTTEQMDQMVTNAVTAANGAAGVLELFNVAKTVGGTIATGGTVDIAGVTGLVPGNLGRPVLITFGAQVSQDTAGGRADLQLWRSVNGAAYVIAKQLPFAAGAAGQIVYSEGTYRHAPTTDDVAYKLAIRSVTGSSTTATVTPSTNTPVILHGLQA